MNESGAIALAAAVQKATTPLAHQGAVSLRLLAFMIPRLRGPQPASRGPVPSRSQRQTADHAPVTLVPEYRRTGRRDSSRWGLYGMLRGRTGRPPRKKRRPPRGEQRLVRAPCDWAPRRQRYGITRWTRLVRRRRHRSECRRIDVEACASGAEAGEERLLAQNAGEVLVEDVVVRRLHPGPLHPGLDGDRGRASDASAEAARPPGGRRSEGTGHRSARPGEWRRWCSTRALGRVPAR